MKRIAVISRLSACVDTNGMVRSMFDNIARAQELCRSVVGHGHAPYASHLLCTQFLRDEVPEERTLGLVIGRAWLTVADEAWVDGIGGRSSGMQEDIRWCEAHNVPVLVPSFLPWIAKVTP